VIRRRLVPLALVVTALLAVVAIAARGRPLGKTSGKGAGLPTSFWSFLFTTFVIVELLLVVLALVALFLFRRERVAVARYNRRTLRALAILIVVAAVVAVVARHINLHHLRPAGSTTPTPPGATSGKGRNKRSPVQHVHFQWEELVVVLVLLVALAVGAWVTRTRLGPGTTRRPRSGPDVLAAALDESLDDLRTDPDLRRAIIAAYARMETALAAAGIPRDPAEAPLEYVERALLTLDASAAAVRRLTDLFEWARFSHHEPEPSMRDDAVDALVSVRDELRASEPAPA
jgi:Domain of unknown function (DUF4129)